MGDFSRYLTSSPYKETIPERVIFVDTETQSVDAGEGVSKLELLLGCYEVWTVDEVGVQAVMTHRGVFTDTDTFYRLLKQHTPTRVVAHNWRFDATVLRIGAKENMERHGYTIDVDSSIIPVQAQGFTPFLITLDFDGELVELICNTNFYKQSLASLGASFDAPKTVMPIEADYDSRDAYVTDLLEYCYNDVEVLRKAYFFLFEFAQEIGGVTPSVTIAMTANRVYRNQFLPDAQIQGSLGIPYISDVEREAYRGGRTDAFYSGNPNTKIYKYDVNSLYPFAMLGDIPVRYVQAVTNDMFRHILAGEPSRFIHLADVTVKIKPTDKYSFIGGEGVKAEGGELIFPIGTYRCWAWQPMIETLAEHGYIDDIHRVYAYNRANIFDDYVNTLYALRERYKVEGDSSRDLLVKILLNSLYGKFGQREHAGWELADEYETSIMLRDDAGVMRFDDAYEGVATEYLQVGGELWKSIPDAIGQPTENAVTSIAGYITTKARTILWNAMRTVLDLGGCVYYCDTDSVFTNIPLPDDMVSDTELGKWKLEGVIPAGEAEFVAPKHYRVGNDWTIKGIRNPSGADSHAQDVFPNFITDLTSKRDARRERLESGAVITRIVKQPTGNNNKRVVCGEHVPTLPIQL